MLAAWLPLRAEAAPDADLQRLMSEAAQYESGQDLRPLQQIEQRLRDSAGKPAERAELEAALVKLLAPSATFEARRFACQLLAVIGTEASRSALADLLKNEETVGIACLALGGQRTPKAAELLRNALPSARGRARHQILGALGNQQDAQSVKTFADLAGDVDPAIAETAILALGRMNTAAAHDAIAALRKQAPPGQVRAVTEATLHVAEQLAAAGQRKAASAIYTELLESKQPTNIRRGALAALMPLDDDGGQQRILDTLSGADPALVPVAIARVGSLKSASASKTFAALLPKLAPGARAWLIEALAGRSDADARSAIRAEVSATDAGVRRAAITAMGKSGDSSAVGLLAKALASAGSPEELQDTEIALAGLGGGAATEEALLAELKRMSGDAKVRLISVVARRGARTAVPALVAEVDGSDIPAVRAALQALGRIAAADDVPALLDKLASLAAGDAHADAEQAAARALARIADVSRGSEIVRGALTKTSSIDARCALLRLLPAAADARALAALESARADKEPRVRDAAVRALAAWPDATGWDALMAVFQRPENTAHRAIALRALARLAGELNAKPDAALVERYRQLLSQARGDDERKLILGALAGAAHPDALQLALPLVSSPGVRAEAEVAVKKIAASIRAEHPQAARAALERLKQTKP